jgi:hypothetical protein
MAYSLLELKRSRPRTFIIDLALDPQKDGSYSRSRSKHGLHEKCPRDRGKEVVSTKTHNVRKANGEREDRR